MKINQNAFLRVSLTKSDVWEGYKYYEKKALFWGFARIQLIKYKKLYWKNKSKSIPL